MWLLILLLLVNAKHEVTFIRSAGELNMGTEYQTLLFLCIKQVKTVKRTGNDIKSSACSLFMF